VQLARVLRDEGIVPLSFGAAFAAGELRVWLAVENDEEVLFRAMDRIVVLSGVRSVELRRLAEQPAKRAALLPGPRTVAEPES